MNKPYIVCHMMMSLDGRIDCKMTSKLRGTKEYYETLSELNVPTTLSGRVTAELEMALPGKFSAKDQTPFGKEGFSKKQDATGYEVVVDTHGTLLWDKQEGEKPLLVITSEQVSQEYFHYLDEQNISWIAVGKNKIDLPKAMDILRNKFEVERMAVVGGSAINTSFLDFGLLDEISILIGPGVDGRKGMPTVFDNMSTSHEVIHLELKDVKKYEDGAVWLRYVYEE